MAQIIKIKRSTTTASPTTLTNGELAYSAVNGGSHKLFIGRPGGGSGDIDAIGGKYFTDIIDSATSSNTVSTLVLRDGSGNFSAGTITATSFFGPLTGNVTGNADTATSATSALTVTNAAQPNITSLGTLTALTVDNLNLDANTISSTTGNLNITPAAGSLLVLDGTINIDAGVVTGATSITSTSFTGSLTGNASTATVLATPRNFSITGDAAATAVSFDGSANVVLDVTLASTGVVADTYGSSTNIPVITVDTKGRVTALSTAAISSSFTISDGANTDVFNNGETLTFTGGTGVTSLVSNNNVAFSIGQNVATTSNVTFNDVSVNGTLASNDITSTNISVTGNAIITGNLTVQGTTTSVESTTVTIDDPVIALADNTTSATSDGLDRGVRFKYGNGSSLVTGFFGLDIQTQRFVFQNDETAATDDFSTPWGDVEFGNVYGTGADLGNITIGITDDQTITTTSGNLVLDAATNVVQITSPTEIDSLSLTTDLAVAHGGTGQSTFTLNGVLFGNTTNGLLSTVAGAWDATNSTGEFLSVNASGVPTWTNTIDGGTY